MKAADRESCFAGGGCRTDEEALCPHACLSGEGIAGVVGLGGIDMRRRGVVGTDFVASTPLATELPDGLDAEQPLTLGDGPAVGCTHVDEETGDDALTCWGEVWASVFSRRRFPSVGGVRGGESFMLEGVGRGGPNAGD